MLALWVIFQLQLCLNSCTLPINDYHEQRIFEFESDGFIPPISLTNFLREIVERLQKTNCSILKLQKFFKKVKSKQVWRQKPPTPHQRRYCLSLMLLAVHEFRVSNAKYPCPFLKLLSSNQQSLICQKQHFRTSRYCHIWKSWSRSIPTTAKTCRQQPELPVDSTLIGLPSVQQQQCQF